MKTIIKSIVFIAGIAIATPKVHAQVSVGISISANIAPPVLPVYTQPVCPGDGYIWTPGYWAYADPDGYYWVPGVWVRPPHFGLLWTPAYWGFEGGVYGFHAGYWGPHVGFYGGINYGYGYGGAGFGGGIWAGNVFRYNTAVANVKTTIVHNTYVNNTVINNTTINRTSFNGQGGVNARPNNQERIAMNEHHVQPTSNQLEHQRTASQDRSQFASVNHGAPTTVAMNRVGGRGFDQHGRVANAASSGKLNAGETRNPETREASLNKDAGTGRANNDGNLTSQDKSQANAQPGRVGNATAADKHNADNPRQAGNPAGDRRANQQQRIAQGIHNGQANAGRLGRQPFGQVGRPQSHAGRQMGHQHHE